MTGINLSGRALTVCTLQVATPTGAVTEFDGGTRMVRCADYVGAARGTLEVVADAESICGNVVHDSQVVPYATSAGFGSPYLADYEYADYQQADPTLVIPYDDLNLEEEIQYVVFAGIKVVGAGDNAHCANETFMYATTQNVDLIAYNEVISDAGALGGELLPRPETNPTYRLIWLAYLSYFNNFSDPPYHKFPGSATPPITQYVFVAAAGEDSTYETYLDAIYFVPYTATTTQGTHYFSWPADPSAWDPLEDNNVTFDPKPTNDDDDSAATNALNIIDDDAGYSVIYADQHGFGTQASGVGSDYQRAKSEPSFYSICGQGRWDGFSAPSWPLDPESWLVVTVGLICIPQQTIETETFGTNHTGVSPPWTFLSASGNYYWRVMGGGSSVDVTGGALDFTNAVCSTNDSRSMANLGAVGFIQPTPGSPSHADLRRTLQYMTAGTIDATAQIHANPDNGQMYAWVGWENHTDAQPNSRWEIDGVALYVDGGDLKATLRQHRMFSGNFSGLVTNRVNFGTSPVTIQGGYSFGDSIRVKVERRYYVWRAKVWMDGDAEPGSWTLEGLQPHLYPDQSNSPTTMTISQYPYTDDDQDNWGQPRRWTPTQDPTIGVVMDPQTGSATVSGRVTFTDFTLSYDPVGDRAPAHLSLEKYDGTVQFGTVEYTTDCVVLSCFEQHTFDADEQGFNVYLWSDSDAAELQAASASDFILRAVIPP